MIWKRSGQRILLWSLGALAGLFFVHHFLNYLRDPVFLGELIMLEIVIASLWRYETVFFPMLILVFVWAGTSLPFYPYALSARWPVLGVGAIAGAALWMRRSRQSFSEFHLVAFLALSAAATSALVSNDRVSSLLKVLSLVLLFLYGSTGARLAITQREGRFVRALLKACQIIVFLSLAAYAAGFALWGNPNSLGAVMGTVMMPTLVWGFLIAETRPEKYVAASTIFACTVLLYVALSRASLLAATVSTVTLCICLRRWRLLIKAALLVAIFVGTAAVFEPVHFARFTASLSSNIVHKGKKEQTLFSSRTTPWEQTVSSLREHPWFGTGWGTSDMGTGVHGVELNIAAGIHTLEGTNREHGNSYLALAEYVGFLGLLPFSLLIFLVIRMIWRVSAWMHRTSNARHCAVPLAMILLAGLVDAFFEDWMVAVGYYLCVFFWTGAFLLCDVMPEHQSLPLRARLSSHPNFARLSGNAAQS